MFVNWMNLAMNSSMLAIESQQVIAMRMARLSMGNRAAAEEAVQMINEKILAMNEAAITLASGGSPAKVVKSYRGKVRANHRRLSAS